MKTIWKTETLAGLPFSILLFVHFLFQATLHLPITIYHARLDCLAKAEKMKKKEGETKTQNVIRNQSASQSVAIFQVKKHFWIVGAPFTLQRAAHNDYADDHDDHADDRVDDHDEEEAEAEILWGRQTDRQTKH